MFLGRGGTAAVSALVLLGLVAGVPSASATAHLQRPRIVGGAAIPADEAPWMADIVFAEGGAYYSCSGTVVAPNLVLTAGHCTESASGQLNDPSGYRVLTGTASLGLGGTVSEVSKLVVAPGYNPVAPATAADSDDVAVLKLTKPVTATPIALAPRNDSALITPGSPVVIEGWGQTNGQDPSSQPTALQAATTVVQPGSSCRAALGALFDPAHQLCSIDAPDFSTSACFGDSGGPMIADDLVGQPGRPTEIGVADEVAGYCDPTEPNIYARLGNGISTWVEGEIHALAPPPPAVRTGVYSGSTAQRRPHARRGQPISLRVVGARAPVVTGLRLGAGVTCVKGRHHRRLWYRFHSIGLSYRISATGRFSGRSAVKPHGELSLTGHLTGAGRASGTVALAWRDRRNGRCSAGIIRWHAQRLP